MLDTGTGQKSDSIPVMKTGLAVLVIAAAWPLGAQQSAPTPAAGSVSTASQEAQPPLTPEQQLEEQIRQVDPLDKSKDKELKARDKSDRKSEKNSEQGQTATPGSIAAEERANSRQTGPQVVPDDDSPEQPVQAYTGPAVLSRSYSVSRPMIPQELKWTESLGVAAVDNIGVASYINSNGVATATDLRGGAVTWSLAGRHYFKRDQVAVSYFGNYSQYPGNGGFSGSNNTLTLDYTHVLSRRLTLNILGIGSILSQNYTNYTLASAFVPAENPLANISVSSNPNIQLTDIGIKQFTAHADLVWQKSARLSFDGGISYFAMAYNTFGNSQTYNGVPLLGMTGEQARGDVNYRLTRKMTIGSYYSFSDYIYPQGWGSSYFSTFGGIFSYAFSRSTEVRLRAGESLIQTRTLQEVPIAPPIAALLGQGAGLIDASSTMATSDISAQIIKDFRRGRTFNVAFAHGVSPGNGYFLTAVQESMSAGFGMPLFRRYMILATVGRDTLSAVAQSLGAYQSDFGSITITRQLGQGVSTNFAATLRHFDLAEFTGLRNQVLLSAGLNWGSTNGRIWPF